MTVSPQAPTPIDDGGPAYPQHDLSGYGFGPSTRGTVAGDEDSGRYTVEGMSLRDHFAAHALIGIVERMNQSGGFPTEEIAARMAYRYADAMLAHRNGGAA